MKHFPLTLSVCLLLSGCFFRDLWNAPNSAAACPDGDMLGGACVPAGGSENQHPFGARAPDAGVDAGWNETMKAANRALLDWGAVR